MARPRTKARKSYEELLQENEEKRKKHAQALEVLEKERKELLASKRDAELSELYQYMQEKGVSAEELLKELKAVRAQELAS